jgi:hypothetical protein
VIPRGRTSAFAAVALLLAAACVMITRTGGPARRHADAPARQPVVSAAAAADRRVAGAGRRPSSLARARRQSRRFIGAFLRYEARGLDDRVRGAFAISATRDVRADLAADAVRGSGKRGRAQLRWLRLFGPVDGRFKASALLDRGGQRSLFEFALAERGGNWRVSELYP